MSVCELRIGSEFVRLLESMKVLYKSQHNVLWLRFQALGSPASTRFTSLQILLHLQTPTTKIYIILSDLP